MNALWSVHFASTHGPLSEYINCQMHFNQLMAAYIEPAFFLLWWCWHWSRLEEGEGRTGGRVRGVRETTIGAKWNDEGRKEERERERPDRTRDKMNQSVYSNWINKTLRLKTTCAGTNQRQHKMCSILAELAICLNRRVYCVVSVDCAEPWEFILIQSFRQTLNLLLCNKYWWRVLSECWQR